MEPLNILVIDTSTDYLKIALSMNGKEVFVDLKNGFRHIENLIPEVDNCFKSIKAEKKELKFIGICTGPGSFTGIRIGIASALGISYGAFIPCLGFSVFDVYKFLFSENQDEIIVPIIDAKKNKFYCSFIEKNKDIGMYDLDISEINTKLNQIDKKIIFTGKDFILIKDKIQITNFEYRYNNGYQSKDLLAYTIYTINSKTELKNPEPIYLRKSEAEISLSKSKKAAEFN
jgi:tRNA threonylcarbamoyladenosine biosynthesis protein TsaB